jgi:hypothetical protein
MLSERPPLWAASLRTPAGPAKTKRHAMAVLLANGLPTAALEAEQPDVGLWLVGFPESMTAGWMERTNDTIEIRSSRGFEIRVDIP